VSSALPRPGVLLGPYPERLDSRQSWLDRAAVSLTGAFVSRTPNLRRLRQFAEQVGAQRRSFENLDERGLRETTLALRQDLGRAGLDDELICKAFALVREVARRELGMEPYDVQLMGGYVMLTGMLAEMETGEGKTLTATLPACTAALAGIPVHVVTVNDYLVARDAELMGPVYRTLGLSVGTVRDCDEDDDVRRAAYACDVTYVTNKQVAFDYLRDRLARGRHSGRLKLRVHQLSGDESSRPGPLLRGLCFAIVDEADSVLIDEARTPLILSRTVQSPELEQACRQALSLAGQLVEGREFAVDQRERRILLTPTGSERLKGLAAPLGGVWTGERRREELVRQALSAQFLYLRDDQYLVRDDKVQIIDPHTGRVMPDRAWEAGLHQMIEAKEDCEISGRRETLARISYQQFYRRYLRLGGMTGTAAEVADELEAVYRLPTVRIPTRLPIRRQTRPDRVYATAEAKWRAVVSRIRELHRENRPVLVGTRSVGASEQLSGLLEQAGLAHQVLNARQDLQEAEIIERAGELGRITVATNMAGRGTDIRLETGVTERDGLHVIATERSEARRIDRQLFGRCGRQGDPGSFEMIMSLEDEVVTSCTSERLRRWLVSISQREHPLVERICRVFVSLAQRVAEGRHAGTRRELLKLEEYLENALAFAGPPK
jgi:preprotein translocase subunit SecA